MLTPEEVTTRYPFIKYNKDNNHYEMYLDHHSLSTLRSCEAMFTESILHSIAPIGGKAWSLEFGAWFHKCLEIYYKVKLHNKEYPLSKWLQTCTATWNKMGLNSFKDQKQFKTLGGAAGALALLMEYYNYHYGWKEKLKIIGAELAFGYGKEVYVGTFPINNIKEEEVWDSFQVDCYLCGRIDLLVDDGTFIGPLDHKTKSSFDGDETSNYKPHDGMLGYAYATDKMLGAHFAEQGKQCRQTIVSHISLKNPDKGEDRFKRSFLQYTPGQFAEFEQRQLASFKRVFELAVLEEQPQWNTSLCANVYYRDCAYKKLHSTPPEARATIRRAFYTEKERWNPYRND